MKKILPLIFIPIFIFIFNISSCAEKNIQRIIDREQEYIEIAFSFNTEFYPWLMGTKYPQIAVWVKSGDESDTVFVTKGAGKNSWAFADERPESLPVWLGIDKKESVSDAITGATPSGEVHNILWQIPRKYVGKKMELFVEANVSYDFNNFYVENEDKKGFSGVNGQPSIIWKTTFFVDEKTKELTPEIIGHGEVFGKNSRIDSDNSKITTAKELFNYIKVEYSPAK